MTLAEVQTFSPSQVGLPPLANGDHLTRDEFLRRYRAMPALKKAELIQGRTYVASPVSAKHHGEPHAAVITLLGVYSASTPGVAAGDNSTVIISNTDVPQPDAYLRLDPSRGGQSQLKADGYVHGASEFVFEIAATSADYDLHEKRETYESAGVREYIVWRTYESDFDCFVRNADGKFERAKVGPDATFRSTVMPGLWLDLLALVRLDLPAALRAVQQGLAARPS